MTENSPGKTDTDRYENLEKRLLEIRAIMEPHQINSVEFFLANKRGLVEAPVGAGKTLIGWTSALVLRPKRILIVCSRNALYTWTKELDKWFPGFFTADEITIIDGQPAERSLQWKDLKTVIKITTFGKLLNDLEAITTTQSKHPFDVILVDEAHRARNRKAKVFEALKEICKPVYAGYPAFIELTGTPGDKGIQHLWGYFHLADPKFFSSYWKFVNTYCEVVDGRFGKEVIGPKNTKGFEVVTRPYFKRITVEETGLHKVVRHLVPLKLSPKIRQVYDQFEDEMIAATAVDQGIMIASTSLDRTVKLRQLLTYPGQFFPSLGLGDLPEWIADKIDDDDSGIMRHSIIFTPFRANITPYREFFENRYQKTVIELYGGMDPKLQKELVDECNRKKGMAICTTLYAQSFEFPEMPAAFMAGYEWSADAMEQAEGRVRRLTSKYIANAYYPQFLNTIDEWLIHVLNRKVKDLNVLFQNFKDRRPTGTPGTPGTKIGTTNSS